MASRVQFQADFAANTSNAEASVKRYTQQIKEANSTLAAQERAARESFQSQSLAIKATTGDTEQLRKVQQQYFQQLVGIRNASKELGSTLVDANRNAATSEDAVAEAVRLTTSAIERETAAVQANVAAHSERGHSISNQSAASGAVQLLEGRNGIRSIENYLGNTLGLGGVFGKLFPVVGAVQSAKLLYDLGDEVYQVEEKARKAGDAFNEAFGALHDKAQTNIADLDLQAAKLQENIDKLSGHPGNGLAVALAEARKSADALGSSLREDRKQMEALFKEQSVGFFGGVLSGQSTTGKQEENLDADAKAFEGQIARINSDFANKASSATSLDQTKSLEKQRDAQIVAAFDQRIATYKREADRLRKEQSDSEAQIVANQALADKGVRTGGSDRAINNGAKLAEIEGVTQQYSDRRSIYAGQINVATLTERELQLKQDKENAEAAKKGSSERNAAERKAEEEQRKLWEDQLAALQQTGKLSAEATHQLWVDRQNATRKGSENYLLAEKESFESLRKVNEEHAKNAEEAFKLQQQFSKAELADANK